MAELSENLSNLRVRKLESWVITTHARLAENAGQSLEQHLRDVLTQQALQAQLDFADEMDKHRAEITEKFGKNFPDSLHLLMIMTSAKNTAAAGRRVFMVPYVRRSRLLHLTCVDLCLHRLFGEFGC
ncbi:MAG: hypothetical protein AAF528_00205 [Cyanobacteria bacterium P01_C01_bin.121]